MIGVSDRRGAQAARKFNVRLIGLFLVNHRVAQDCCRVAGRLALIKMEAKIYRSRLPPRPNGTRPAWVPIVIPFASTARPTAVRILSRCLPAPLAASVAQSADAAASHPLKLPSAIGLNAPMPDLTRRPDPHRADCWLVHYGDVRFGTIAHCLGPNVELQWPWLCGFYPGSNPGELPVGTAGTFDQARAEFEAAWRVYLPKRSAADFQAWRDHQASTKEKYARVDRYG